MERTCGRDPAPKATGWLEELLHGHGRSCSLIQGPGKELLPDRKPHAVTNWRSFSTIRALHVTGMATHTTQCK